jgi:hypothetical protein
VDSPEHHTRLRLVGSRARFRHLSDQRFVSRRSPWTIAQFGQAVIM